ncbi:MAG: stage II sporulation protein D [Oscillospiraceae bacterium]|nr:stage II sporulation protein D [Oscillospiraceae bacterium]
MKRHFLHCILFAALLTAMPLLPAYLLKPQTAAGAETPLVFTEYTESAETGTITETTAELSTTEPETVESVTYHVLDTASGEILEVPLREYLIGAVGAEMPVSFEMEALKAQAVAAHTYAERQCLLSPHRPELNGADFSNDPAVYQAYLTENEQRERWGTHYAAYYARLAEAVDAVLHEVLVYEDEPIIAAFHAMSSGRTESAANVWGSEVAYLCSVESDADRTAPEYEKTAVFTAEEVQERLTAAHTGLTINGDPSGWFGEPTATEAGTVLQMPVGNGIFTGQELRTLFELRSAAFTVSYADGSFTFTTYGYGHDVGMSQYGANALAAEGQSYQEILAYYYPNTNLIQR